MEWPDGAGPHEFTDSGGILRFVEPRSFLPTAARWVFAHAAGMALGMCFLLSLHDEREAESPSLGVICAVQGIQAGLTQIIALRWLRAPYPLLAWGLTTMIGWAIGLYLGVQTFFQVMFKGTDLGRSASEIAPLGSAASALTWGVILALAQSALVFRWTDRKTAIHWGGWTLVACGAATLPDVLGLESALGLKGMDDWIRLPIKQAVYGIIFATVSVPALKRLLAAKATSR